MTSFVHLHNHSHYSVLDGLSKPVDMIAKAKELNQAAIALTDHGNMMGAIDFYNAAKAAGIKPILGCEVYLTSGSRKEKSKDRFHLVLLIQNTKGYQNLMYMLSQSYLTGFYSKPRIDYELLEEYSEGLIALSACVAGEVPKTLIDKKLHKITDESYEEAKKIALNYEQIFGKDNFYLEIQHHPEITLREDNTYKLQIEVNKALIKMSKETGIGLIATNDSHYVNIEDNVIQDALICVNTGKLISERNNRMCMMDGNYSILSTEEMNKYFSSTKDALENSVKIAERCNLEIKFGRELIPVFDCPDGMNEKEYLLKLSIKGLKDRFNIEYNPETDEYFLAKGVDESTLTKPLKVIIERMKYELGVINKMGFPGYFLIVLDFVNWTKDNGYLVGPGRGSAAGALVTYLVKITDIDPLKYDLLFERFLNPERISMPDIDIDFQDDGRSKVLEYVRNKYGNQNVCQVVTYQSMAAKNSIRDIGRVKDLPLPVVNKIANTIPSKPGTSLKKAFANDMAKLKKEVEWQDFYKLYSTEEVYKNLIDMARRIEGTIRGTGTHACAVIISGEPVYKYAPLMYPPKDTTSVITQYEGPQLEDIGLLKMDFLGLRNLSIIANCLTLIKTIHNIDLDISNIPLTDKKTFELYSRGDTNGIFQFESGGMKKSLRELKPDRFEDLVAMNALYRPGPMQYIPNFIHRKHGKEEIVYNHPLMKKYLEETYGITVYQEQVMLLSQHLGGFTGGQADSLRKAMGKKKKKLMDELKLKFIDGCKANPKFIDGFEPTKELKTIDELINKIWSDWETFTEYAFNKSHSVCYAYVSYQTAYLKANYPLEYMSAMLNSVIENADKVIEYISVCEDMGIEIIPPDINYSEIIFSPMKKNTLTFGLNAIKNVGTKALKAIISERKSCGKFSDIYDFFERVDVSKINRRVLEFLIRAGAFDSLGHTRRQLIESLDDFIPHFQKYAKDKLEWTNSLFGDISGEASMIEHPKLHDVAEWDKRFMLEQEKEFSGFYISGHPLDEYKDLIKSVTFNKKIEAKFFRDGQQFKMGGLISHIKSIITKKGNAMAVITLLTLYGEEEIVIFPKDYVDCSDKLIKGDTFIFDVHFQLKDDGSFGIIYDKMQNMIEASNLVNRIKINLIPDQIDSEKASELVAHLERNKGNTEVLFIISDKKNGLSNIVAVNGMKLATNFSSINRIKEILNYDNCVVFDS